MTWASSSVLSSSPPSPCPPPSPGPDHSRDPATPLPLAIWTHKWLVLTTFNPWSPMVVVVNRYGRPGLWIVKEKQKRKRKEQGPHDLTTVATVADWAGPKSLPQTHSPWKIGFLGTLSNYRKSPCQAWKVSIGLKQNFDTEQLYISFFFVAFLWLFKCLFSSSSLNKGESFNFSQSARLSRFSEDICCLHATSHIFRLLEQRQMPGFNDDLINFYLRWTIIYLHIILTKK